MDSAATPNAMQARLVKGLLLAVILLAGCKSTIAPGKPAIQITQVPTASIGGPTEMDAIAGRVTNARPGQQVVLYALSGVWWIQPLANQPYTKIQADSTWNNLTHLGNEYAAILVEPGYHPAAKLLSLPVEGDGVVSVAVAQGKMGAPVAAAAAIHFGGYDWIPRSTASDHGGEYNEYNPANAWTDNKGYLHLRMAERDGKWTCAEVSLDRSLGYGTYTFVVEDSAHLRPSAVLGMFTWDDVRSTNFRNELDIELSRWGDAKAKNAQYVVQPYFAADNLSRFNAPAGPETYILRWEPGRAAFKTIKGDSGSGGAAISEHVFTSSVPAPANEMVHIDLYDLHHSASSSQQPAEAVIEKFEFTPLSNGSDGAKQ